MAFYPALALAYYEPSRSLSVTLALTLSPCLPGCPDSIWLPRKKSSPGGDFYDTPEAKARAFTVDWDLACERMSLEKKIQRANSKLDQPETEPSETFHSALAPFAEVIFQAFICYASQGTGSDIFAISRNAYLQFIRDLELVDNGTIGQRDQDMQILFESANASASKEHAYNARVRLGWVQRLGAVVSWGVAL